ncbi:MAG: hypothetical protein HYW62_00605 [Candidatus Levybacteria bacterium]|nr:hypothetical protein [Candidatus Levybacteria bacterium]
MRLFARNLLFIISFIFLLLFPSNVSAAELQPGSVWQWNDASASAVTQKQGLSNVASVSIGRDHSLALESDGTVWAWGNNQYGQLGNGESGGSLVDPVQVKLLGGGYLTDVKGISAGYKWSIAIRNDGTVWVWGYDGYGARGAGVGNNDSDSKLLVATQVKGPSNFLQIVAIAAGDNHSIALKADGSVFAWGLNNNGQVGIGCYLYNCSRIDSPVKVLDNAIAIAAGGHHTLAVKADQTVWGWGRTSEGQLGSITGSFGVQGSPIQIPGISGIKNVWAKTNWNVALSNNGSLFGWGHGSYTYSGDRNPKQVSGLGEVTLAAVGQTIFAPVGIAVKGDGTLWWWNAENNSNPTQISTLSNIGSVAVGLFTPSLASVFLPAPTPTPTPTPTPKTPLILIPGIGGSELKVVEETYWLEKDDGHGGNFNYIYPTDETVWLNEDKAKDFGEDDYFDVLRMKNDGITSEANIGITENLLGRAYQGTIDFFISNGYELNKNFFVFPYYWRKDIALTALLLNEKINEIKTQTGSQKVDIVAHSMGGLVARNYISDVTKAQNVRKLFTLGTPHLGSVDSLKNLRYGACLTPLPISLGPLCLGIADTETNDVVQNMVSVFQLVPSQAYFNFYSGEDNQHPFPYRTESGTLNYMQIKNLLTGLNFNTPLFNPSEAFHTLDNSLFSTNGVDVTLIAGSGQKTLGQIVEEKRTSLLGIPYIHKDTININGDGTVSLFSASLNDSDNGISFLGNAKVFYTKQDHGNLVSSGSALNLIKNILNDDNQLPVGVSAQPYFFSGSQISVHSPVNIHVYDSLGNHTGPTSNGDFEANIPGSSYDTLDDAKFIWLPDNGQYDIKFEATDQGSFDFKIRKYEDDENTETILYKEIPLANNTKAETSFDTQSSEVPIIRIDEDGNGNFDFNIEHFSILEGDANYDYTPPTISSAVNPKSIWPPNNKMVNVNITGAITDENPYLVTILVDDEYDLIEPSITIQNQTNINETIKLEASRKGGDKDGRKYTIKILATDLAGNTSLSIAEVIVPHDQRK